MVFNGNLNQVFCLTKTIISQSFLILIQFLIIGCWWWALMGRSDYVMVLKQFGYEHSFLRICSGINPEIHNKFKCSPTLWPRRDGCPKLTDSSAAVVESHCRASRTAAADLCSKNHHKHKYRSSCCNARTTQLITPAVRNRKFPFCKNKRHKACSNLTIVRLVLLKG